MIQTRNGWQEIINKDGTHRSYMVIYTPAGEDNWDEMIGYVLKINRVVKDYHLENAADVSINAGVLTILFHSPENEELPYAFREAGKALSDALTDSTMGAIS